MMPAMNDYRYETMSQEHLQEVVALHQECFRGYYLTELGPSFLRAMYGWYVTSREAIAYVALDRDGHVAGFVAGTADDSNYRRSLFRRTWWHMTIALGKRVVSKPALTLRLLGERKELVSQALATVLARRSAQTGRTAAVPDEEPRAASLVSIGVMPSARRSRLGTALSELFVREAWSRGSERITLSVRDDNVRARRFYESMNWEEAGRSSRTYRGSFSIIYEKAVTHDQKN
jgi:ribosomal protein S18 acetylase RimI-like enzyme